MKELLYIEIPTPDTAAVRDWLQQQFVPPISMNLAKKFSTSDGIKLVFSPTSGQNQKFTDTDSNAAASELAVSELAVFTWSVQRTTYLKAFRWAKAPLPQEGQILQQLTQGLRVQFPHRYPEPPAIDLSQQSIFEALAPYYPKTVHYFGKMPNGEADLIRAYWWEQRWREGVRNPQRPKQVVFRKNGKTENNPTQNLKLKTQHSIFDLIYIGGALGVIHAAVMARLGYRVLLMERLPFGRMNREWNISRAEFQSLIELGLFTSAEFEALIAREYKDGFHKFFDANNPPQAKAPILHTPTVLNVAIDAEKLLKLCGEKLRAAGGEIWDETEFIQAEVSEQSICRLMQFVSSRAAC
jgi:lycopene cyclase CruA